MAKKQKESSNPKIEQMMIFLQDLRENLEKDSWTKIGLTKLADKHGLTYQGLKPALINTKFIESNGNTSAQAFRLGKKSISEDLAEEVLRLRRLAQNERQRRQKSKRRKPRGVFPDSRVIDFRELEIPQNPLTKGIIEDRNASAKRLYEEIISSDAFQEILKLDQAIRDGIKN